MRKSLKETQTVKYCMKKRRSIIHINSICSCKVSFLKNNTTSIDPLSTIVKGEIKDCVCFVLCYQNSKGVILISIHKKLTYSWVSNDLKV